jgi:ribonuclease BN (tRNA processing enzyme)
MDVSEGTYGQLWDHFSDKAKVDEVLLKTRAIFITHMHGDHCLGIGKIMHERDQLVQPMSCPVYIVIPPTIWDWVDSIR